jgi:hypothetical protein
MVVSILLQFGIHSFPVLAMHNSTSRVRYYGPRTLEILIFFYQNYTGEQSASSQVAFAENQAQVISYHGCAKPQQIICYL